MSTARKVSITQFEEQSRAIVRQARRGQIIEITENGRTVARLVPAEGEKTRNFRDDPSYRKPGAWAGQGWIAGDFNETPEDFADSM